MKIVKVSVVPAESIKWRLSMILVLTVWASIHCLSPEVSLADAVVAERGAVQFSYGKLIEDESHSAQITGKLLSEEELLAGARRRLWSQLWDLGMSELLEKHHIVVSSTEVRRYFFGTLFPATGTAEIAQRIHDKFTVYADGLEAVVERGVDPHAAFEEYVKKSYPDEEAWLFFVRSYNSPEKLQDVRSGIPKDEEDMFQKSYESTERALKEQRLLELLTKGVQLTEAEKQSAIQQATMEHKNPAASIEDALKQKKSVALSPVVWKQAKQGLTILDKRFEGP